ncbi:MAG: DNA-binding protein [Lentisphaerae bacterium GWF2_45_14]|nr:MAG: DNA-binding protein [Lentisphaerae bacterium GWF2_45_14]
MKYSMASQGRIFVIRLEDGDVLHEEVEKFAKAQVINAAYLIAVGGADSGSRLIVGPEDGRASQINPMQIVLDGVHEISGTGTIFPDEDGNPILHMHAACGRKDSSVTGCVRAGVNVWHVLEIVLVELLNSTACRRLEPESGFKLLQP